MKARAGAGARAAPQIVSRPEVGSLTSHCCTNSFLLSIHMYNALFYSLLVNDTKTKDVGTSNLGQVRYNCTIPRELCFQMDY